MAGLRVFISYAHNDMELAGRIAAHLEAHDMMALWDKNFSYGHGFHDQIKVFISYAHIFLPIITEASSRRGWVHQEIGYAMALNVPILPVTVGKLPEGMLQGLQAVLLDAVEVDLLAPLRPNVILGALSGQDDFKQALYRCADESEQRATMIHDYAEEIRQIGYDGVVRQSGALSSFHIPDKSPAHQVWKERYGDKPKSTYHCELQRSERKALEYHARKAVAALSSAPKCHMTNTVSRPGLSV